MKEGLQRNLRAIVDEITPVLAGISRSVPKKDTIVDRLIRYYDPNAHPRSILLT
jgi:hypothetical protein